MRLPQESSEVCTEEACSAGAHAAGRLGRGGGRLAEAAAVSAEAQAAFYRLKVCFSPGAAVRAPRPRLNKTTSNHMC